MLMNQTLNRLQELDPSRGVELAETQWEQMFEKIVAAPVQRRTPLWRRPYVTIPVFVALTAGAFVLTSAVAGDKVIEIRAADALRDPRSLEQDLARQGLDARIVAVPADDILAGKWVHLYVEPDDDMDLDMYYLLRSMAGLLDMRFPSVNERCPIGDCARTSLLEIPGRVHGPITLVVGREPRPSEDLYWTDAFLMNELAPGAALYCYRLEEKTPEEAAETLRSSGYRVSWEYETKTKGTQPVDAPPDGAVITVASFRGPAEVTLMVADPDDSARIKVAEGTPTSEHPRSSAPWASCD
jgi:hypothetical protein